MNKIIKSSALFLGTCFFAGTLNAQLSSDKPAMTPEQVKQIMQVQKAAVKETPKEASVSTVKPVDVKQLPNTVSVGKTVSSSTEGSTVVSDAKTLPVAPANVNTIPVSDQGGVKLIMVEKATPVKPVYSPAQISSIIEKIKPKQ